MMNKSPILKTMQILFLVTTFAPVTAFARSAVTAQQLLALAQSQSQAQVVKGDLDKVSGRVLSQGAPEPLKAAERSSAVAAADPLLAIPLPATQVTEPAFEKGALNMPAPPSILDVTPAQTPPDHSISQVASLPTESRLAADSNKAEMEVQVALNSGAGAPTRASLAENAPALGSISQSDAGQAMPVPAARLGANVASPEPPTAQPTPIPAAVAAKLTKDSPDGPRPHQQGNRTRATAHGSGQIIKRSERFDGGNAAGELQKIINRPEVRSLMAQYGLN
jgi:hypothetical protein